MLSVKISPDDGTRQMNPNYLARVWRPAVTEAVTQSSAVCAAVIKLQILLESGLEKCLYMNPGIFLVFSLLQLSGLVCGYLHFIFAENKNPSSHLSFQLIYKIRKMISFDEKICRTVCCSKLNRDCE